MSLETATENRPKMNTQTMGWDDCSGVAACCFWGNLNCASFRYLFCKAEESKQSFGTKKIVAD